MKRLFCFGLGYSALALADTLLAEGWAVAGTCRSEEKRARLDARGIGAHLFKDGRLAVDPSVLATATHILSSVPPDKGGDPVLAALRTDIATIPGLDWVGYLSTTGVYGDRDGGWVDEDAERRPTGERSRRRMAAEDGWLDLWRDHRVPVHLFRLAGIYGPGRNQLGAVRARTAQRIDKPGQVFSRIHVADIVTVLRASMTRPQPGTPYNVCDDEPAPPPEVTAYACQLMAVDSPPLVPFATAALSDMARSFYADNKRVCNRRIKDRLGVRLQYPNYRAGLSALAAAQETS